MAGPIARAVLHMHRVHGDCRPKILAGHQIVDERVPGRRVDALHEPAGRHGQQEEVGRAGPEDPAEPQRRCYERLCGLRGLQGGAAGAVVRHPTAQGTGGEGGPHTARRPSAPPTGDCP